MRANESTTGQLNRRAAIGLTLGGLASTSMTSSVGGKTAVNDPMAIDLTTLPRQLNSTPGHPYAVATVHPLATDAAKNAFARGGNAFDAAIAAAFMLGVVDGHNSGMGGGCFILARSADGKLVAIDGRETAPGLAHRDMYLRDGVVDTLASKTGPLASGVPGQVHALSKLSKLYGRIGWDGALREAAEVAREGFPVGISTHSAIACVADLLRRYPASASQFLTAADGVPAIGDRFQQPDLARTLESIAEDGTDWFYKGPFASQCDQWMRDNGGLLRADDFANYSAPQRQPLRTQYRDWQIIGFPPPSSGGIHVAQMLMMLAEFDVKSIFHESSAKGLHLLSEVMRRAFADRAHWLGDSDFAAVPKALLDRQYCRELAASIDLDRVSPVASHGTPPRAESDLFSRQHTTHLTTADMDGNWVAITNTINTTFGSCVVIPGTGVVMNNEMDDFSISPGTPNYFGLIGAEANCIEAGKRPLSSMSPTIVLDAAGKPRLTCGAAGGPRIISTVLQCIVRVLDLGMTVERALSERRVHHQWSPNLLVLEPQAAASTVDQLRDRGHKLSEPFTIGVAQAIEQATPGVLTAAHDPRVDGIGAAVACN